MATREHRPYILVMSPLEEGEEPDTVEVRARDAYGALLKVLNTTATSVHDREAIPILPRTEWVKGEQRGKRQ